VERSLSAASTNAAPASPGTIGSGQCPHQHEVASLAQRIPGDHLLGICDYLREIEVVLTQLESALQHVLECLVAQFL